MKNGVAFIIASLLLTPYAVGASLLSEVPAHFMVDVRGQAAGVTESGLTFSQTNVANGLGVRLRSRCYFCRERPCSTLHLHGAHLERIT